MTVSKYEVIYVSLQIEADELIAKMLFNAQTDCTAMFCNTMRCEKARLYSWNSGWDQKF